MSGYSFSSIELTDADSARGLITHIQSLAARAGVELRDPPPEPTTCCGRGCNGCVWEGYFAAVSYWCGEAELLLS